MKGLIRFLLLLGLCTFVSCEKEELCNVCEECVELEVCNYEEAPLFSPGKMLFGRVAGVKNCLPFIASAKMLIFPPDSTRSDTIIGIEVRTFEEWGSFFANKESIYITTDQNRIGDYSLFSEKYQQYGADYNTVQDHDVFEDSFTVDTSYDNTISIRKIDYHIGYIEGSFDCRFILSSNIPSGNNPDTICFSQCYFVANVEP